ncbi:MAG TPA: hypothetical protein VK083_06665 [Nocardia sp.]|uniref:hypothetical protein n=1 Tax=Nocardia TaxID=1817 RepID=UPI0024545304|nr:MULTISPECIES: hypothetical protein [Nocardia]HLS76455.1 hypothetical protein [Nocardia sp.]
MKASTRTVRLGLAALAIAGGLVGTAGPAAADTAGTGSSSVGTGSAEVANSLIRWFGCQVGAISCPIVIPL